MKDYMKKQIDDMAYTIHVHERTLAEYAATVLTRDKRIAELTTLGRTLSERNRWLVHDIDMLKTEIKRLETLAEQRRLDLAARDKRIAKLEQTNDSLHMQIEEVGFRCQILETGLAERDKRLAEFETSFDRRTRRLRDLTLERLQRGT